MGTELFPHREKVAEFPPLPPLTARLQSPLTGNCPQNSGAIRECAENISNIEDWLAELFMGVRPDHAWMKMRYGWNCVGASRSSLSVVLRVRGGV